MIGDRKGINRKNKQRSRTMEQEVARLVGGNRVPMSGAGKIKGDVFAPFDEYRSYYIECKLTQHETLSLPVAVFSKALEECKEMRLLFPVFVFKFVNQRKVPLYSFVHEQAQKFIDIPEVFEPLELKTFKFTGNLFNHPKWYKMLSGCWYLEPFSCFLDRIPKP